MIVKRRKEIAYMAAQINVRISDEDKEILDKIAKEEDRTVSWLVRKAIQLYVESKQQNVNVEG
jgi:predicted transcriptional regulator